LHRSVPLSIVLVFAIGAMYWQVRRTTF